MLSGLVVCNVFGLFWGITWRISDIPPSSYSCPHAKLRKQWKKSGSTLSTYYRTQYCSDWTCVKNLVRCFTPVWKQLLPVSAQQPSKVSFSTQKRINNWWTKGCQDWALALKSHSIDTGDKDLDAIFIRSAAKYGPASMVDITAICWGAIAILGTKDFLANVRPPEATYDCQINLVNLVLPVWEEVERKHRWVLRDVRLNILS